MVSLRVIVNIRTWARIRVSFKVTLRAGLGLGLRHACYGSVYC
jgi:hypothetical protein